MEPAVKAKVMTERKRVPQEVKTKQKLDNKAILKARKERKHIKLQAFIDLDSNKGKSYAKLIRERSTQNSKINSNSNLSDVKSPKNLIKARSKVRLSFDKNQKPKDFCTNKNYSKIRKSQRKRVKNKATINKPISVNLFRNESVSSTFSNPTIDLKISKGPNNSLTRQIENEKRQGGKLKTINL